MKKMQTVVSSLQKEEPRPAVIFAALGLAFIGFLFLFAPASAEAAQDSARLGGGNALVRAITGIEHANEGNDLVSRLLIVSRHGGKPDDFPSEVPENDGGLESGNGEDENVPDGTTDGPPVQNPENSGNDENNNENGGASSGNGGHGGNAGHGGLVRAGDTVSKAHAVNVLNATLVRIGS